MLPLIITARAFRGKVDSCMTYPLIYTGGVRKIVLLVHDIRSTHNVGSLLRTADCFGVTSVFLTGYTPYPRTDTDDRLPHIADKMTAQISKTALGAEATISWHHRESIVSVLDELTHEGYSIIGLEQTTDSIPLPEWKPPEKLAILLGREVSGIDAELLTRCEQIVEIPQFGAKESLNVVQATAVALYHARFAPFA